MSAESPSYTVPLSPPSCGPPMSARNVIIFGESGVGKSSIVNMLLGERQAPTSTSARGCTIASVPYDVDFGDGVSVRVHDTAGLDESSAGTVKPENAVANLYNLLCKLEDGISLLVFVTRLGRITKRNQKNYRLFFDGICQGNVPIVLVVTHGEDACEDDDDDIGEAMDRWWRENAQHFQRNEMFFDGQAVVVATKKGYKEEYEKSRQNVRDLVRLTHLKTPWKMDELEWVVFSVRYLYSLCGWAVKSNLQKFLQKLSDRRVTQREVETTYIDGEMDPESPFGLDALESPGVSSSLNSTSCPSRPTDTPLYLRLAFRQVGLIKKSM